MLASRRTRWHLFCQFIASVFLVSVLNGWVSQLRGAQIIRSPIVEICKLAAVSKKPASTCGANGEEFATIRKPCRWDVRVVSASRPKYHPLLLRSMDQYTDSDLKLLRALDGCESVDGCNNQNVTCSYGTEDPSDAFWLRDYNFGSKFVVLFRVGMASLLLYILAILADGSLFYPHRPGSFSIASGTVVFLIAFSSLLYLVLVPRDMQLSLYGGGIRESITYCLLVVSIAATLPAVAIIWLSLSLLMIYFVGFLIEQIFCMAAGILHFLGALCLFHVENAVLHLRLIYLRDIEEEEDLDRRLLELSRSFLRRMRDNWFLSRIPTALEEDGLQIVETTLPSVLYEALIQEEERVPRIDFDEIENANGSDSADGDTNASTPLLQRPTAR